MMGFLRISGWAAVAHARGWHAPVNSSFIMRLVIAPFRLISLATMRRHRRRQLPPKLLRPSVPPTPPAAFSPATLN